MKTYIITNGESFKAIYGKRQSKIIPLNHHAKQLNGIGNPYSIYGPFLEEWLEIDKYDLNITVCKVVGGDL